MISLQKGKDEPQEVMINAMLLMELSNDHLKSSLDGLKPLLMTRKLTRPKRTLDELYNLYKKQQSKLRQIRRIRKQQEEDIPFYREYERYYAIRNSSYSQKEDKLKRQDGSPDNNPYSKWSENFVSSEMVNRRARYSTRRRGGSSDSGESDGDFQSGISSDEESEESSAEEEYRKQTKRKRLENGPAEQTKSGVVVYHPETHSLTDSTPVRPSPVEGLSPIQPISMDIPSSPESPPSDHKKSSRHGSGKSSLTSSSPSLSTASTSSAAANAARKRRKSVARQRATPEQVEVLERLYARTQFPSSGDIESTAAQLDMDLKKVKNWFQNKRAKERRMRDAGLPVPSLNMTSVNMGADASDTKGESDFIATKEMVDDDVMVIVKEEPKTEKMNPTPQPVVVPEIQKIMPASNFVTSILQLLPLPPLVPNSEPSPQLPPQQFLP